GVPTKEIQDDIERRHTQRREKYEECMSLMECDDSSEKLQENTEEEAGIERGQEQFDPEKYAPEEKFVEQLRVVDDVRNERDAQGGVEISRSHHSLSISERSEALDIPSMTVIIRKQEAKMKALQQSVVILGQDMEIAHQSAELLQLQ
ncbi:hypothetical protein KI387_000235, partial [Taxus chinensis]